MTHENDERLARRMGATFVPHDYDREQVIRSALERWKALPDDERNGERPWIMGFNAGWEAALEAQPAPAEDALRSALEPHLYKPDPDYPWFCGDCGYAEHELLKHLPRQAPTGTKGDGG